MKRIYRQHPQGVRCDQCADFTINGLPVHEFGCPNDGKAYLPEEGRWVNVYECDECGNKILEGDSCDCTEPVYAEEGGE